tara:strand:+ start:1206 stop:1385 length:180 start_codon:yes stop_codon:yes gene_type:complete
MSSSKKAAAKKAAPKKAAASVNEAGRPIITLSEFRALSDERRSELEAAQVIVISDRKSK